MPQNSQKFLKCASATAKCSMSRYGETAFSGRDTLMYVAGNQYADFFWLWIEFFFIFFVGYIEQFGLLAGFTVLEQHLGERGIEHAGMAGTHFYTGAAQRTSLGIGNRLAVCKGDGVYGT